MGIRTTVEGDSGFCNRAAAAAAAAAALYYILCA